VLFNIIHQPEKHSNEIIEIAKKVALSKGIPIYSKREYEELVNRYKSIIKKIVQLSSNDYSSNSIHKIFEKYDLDKKDRLLILAEVQKKIDENKKPTWKIILKIIIFIIALLMFLARL
jgi:hypothetical protein